MDKDLNNLTNINEEFADLRKSLGGNQFVLVPPYDEEPMVMKECHHNVTKTQLERGGRSVLGFCFLQRNEKEIFIDHHSVWETPKGSLVDVTFDKPVIFLPVKYFDANKEWYFTNAVFLFPNNMNVVLTNPFGREWIEKPRDWLQDANLEWGFIHPCKYPRHEDEEYQEYLEDYYKDIRKVV